MRVIEGADEGIYGWVGLNYMQGQLVPGLGAGTPGSAAAPDASEREVTTFTPPRVDSRIGMLLSALPLAADRQPLASRRPLP